MLLQIFMYYSRKLKFFTTYVFEIGNKISEIESTQLNLFG